MTAEATSQFTHTPAQQRRLSGVQPSPDRVSTISTPIQTELQLVPIRNPDSAWQISTYSIKIGISPLLKAQGAGKPHLSRQHLKY